ncbi:MAG: pyrroline-5-carboxylate reductase dimerization domain-containing protein [Desulfurococcaceae archaeon]
MGFGRLGEAIARGLINAGYDGSSILVYDKSNGALERARSLGLRVLGSARDVCSDSTAVFVSVKPGDVEEVLRGLSDVASGKVVFSTAALVPLERLSKALGTSGGLYRVMPNIMVKVNKGFIGVAPPRRERRVEGLLSLLGEVVWVEEEVLDMLTLASASTPAVVAELADAILLSALKLGVPYDVARRATASVLEGVGALLRHENSSSLRDSVITPGGVTIRMIEKLYSSGAKAKLLEALSLAMDEYRAMLTEFRSRRQ